MLTLDATTKSLQVTLAEGITTNQLPYVAAYVDLAQATIALTGSGAADGVTTGTTPVTVVAAPAASTTRKLNYLSVVNLDTIAHTVSVQVLSSASTRVICRGTLATGEQLHFTDARGFYALDAAGQVKQAGGVGGGTPGGSDTQVQFNDAGAFGGDSGLTFNKTTDTLTVGSLLQVTGGQIQFPATQVPSAGSNVLDDYEEGTWTPTILGATGTAGGYTTQTGHYVKVGQLVTVWFDVQLSSKGTLSGNISIGGFPVALHASHPAGSVAIMWTTATSFIQVNLGLQAGLTQGLLLASTAASVTYAAVVMQASDLGATSLFRGVVAYRAA